MKKLAFDILALLIVFSIVFTSVDVFATEEVPGDNEITNEATGEVSTGELEGEPEHVGGKPRPNNNGASEDVNEEGFKLVSPSDDEDGNLDLYFNIDSLAFKVAQKDKVGNITKVWGSQLSYKDLGIKLTEVDPEPASDDPDKKEKNEKRQKQIEQRQEEIDNINIFDRQSMSLFILTYVNLGDTINVTENTKCSYDLKVELVKDSYVETGNGIKFKVFIPELMIIVPFVFEIDGKALNIGVPQDGIWENLEGAVKVREATVEIEDITANIANLINKVKSNIKDVSEKDKSTAKLDEVYGNLNKIKEALITGAMKNVTVDSVKVEISRIYESIDRRGIFGIYPKIEPIIKEIVETCNDCVNKMEEVLKEVTYGIYGISVAPFLGHGTTKEDGYVFFPDGAGAISKFNEPHPASLGSFSIDVYKEQVLSEDTVMGWGSDCALYPVFGVNKVDYGFVAIIDKGDCDSGVYYYPGNNEYVLSRVYSSLYYRRKAKYYRNGGVIDVYEINRVDYDRNVKYIFLEDKEAGYSGMANAFKEHLRKNGLLNKAIKENEEMPIEVDFFMSAKEEGVFGKKTIVMTSFETVKETLERLRNDGVKGKIYSTLIEWTKRQGYPNPLDAERALGGSRKLKELAEYATGSDVILGLDVNPVFAQREYATSTEIRKYYTKNNILVPLEFKMESFNRAYLSPKYIEEQYYNKLLNKMKSYGVNSASINIIGSRIYFDYLTKDNILSREDTANIFSDLVKKTNTELGNSSVYHGNMYVWNNATRISDLPLGSTEYLFADESVPFLQMVLHGNIGFTGQYPYNTMYDNDKQTLQYIEYGCPPHFIVTKEDMSKMNFAQGSWNWDWLFSTSIDLWYDDILSVYNEFNDNIGYLWDKEIVHHSTLEKNVKRVEYSDGSVIYINYNKEEKEITDPYDNTKISMKAQSYHVRKGDK